jgi:hypothetical protein
METITKQPNTVHFTIGENAGILLMQIAQEHLLYNYNPQKAVDTITNSLRGCPVDLALKIINGDVILLVDVEEQQIIPVDRIAEIHDILITKLDLKDWYKRKGLKIFETGQDLKKALDKMLVTMKYNHIYKEYDYSLILDFVSGNDEALLSDFRETQEVSELAMLIGVTKSYIEQSLKIKSVMDWIRKTYSDEFAVDYNKDNPLDYVPEDDQSMLIVVMQKLNDILTIDFSNVTAEQKVLTDYIDAVREIDKVIEKGIVPVNILDNWSAGWLAPNGDYYGLNGEIANMIHIQIANALQDKGIIPKNEKDDVHNIINNPDAWLEQQGWVKIHGNNVQFAGCLNVQILKENVDLTKEQIQAIYEYISKRHNGVMKLGWRLEVISIAKFMMFADNLPAMYKKYFEF